MRISSFKFQISVLLALLLAALAPRAEAAPQQMKITFGGYTGKSEALANFPVLVVFTNNVGGSSSFNYNNFLSSSGYDLRFGTNSTDTASSLNYEIESWNTNGASYVWVQVPTIPTDGSGAIWANWGNTSATNQLPCTTNGATWDADYKMVWHLNDASNPADSTTNKINGTNTSTVNSTGVAANGVDTTASAYIQSSDAKLPLGSTARTLEGWFKSTSTANSIILHYGASDQVYLGMYNLGNNKRAAIVGGNPGNVGDSVDMNDGKWHHVVGTIRSGVANGTVLYVDGSQKGANTSTWNWNTTSSTKNTLGRAQDGSQQFTGSSDEVRISAVARSSNWVWATYQTMALTRTSTSMGRCPVRSALRPPSATIRPRTSPRPRPTSTAL
jgi:hypothetical protein